MQTPTTGGGRCASVMYFFMIRNLMVMSPYFLRFLSEIEFFMPIPLFVGKLIMNNTDKYPCGQFPCARSNALGEPGVPTQLRGLRMCLWIHLSVHVYMLLHLSCTVDN